jgi:hypothetical protein
MTLVPYSRLVVGLYVGLLLWLLHTYVRNPIPRDVEQLARTPTYLLPITGCATPPRRLGEGSLTVHINDFEPTIHYELM